jgi:hypothetical protein
MAYAPYGHTLQALEWVEATLTRLYRGHVGAVLGGLRRMQPTSPDAAQAIENCWVHLHKGIDLRRDTLPSIRYSEQLNSITISATLQSTDRRYAIVG